MNHAWCIIANGTPCSRELIEKLQQSHALCACDGAMEWLQSYTCTVDVVIGDMDSITPQTLKTLKQHTHYEIIHDPRQNTTDSEKALLYCLDQGAMHITMVSATGRRLDHTLYQLHLLRRFTVNTNCHIEIRQETEITRYLGSGHYTLSSTQPQTVSIIGFPAATISTTGLKYDVTSYEIGPERHSTSNQLVAQQGTLAIEGEALLCTHPDILIRPDDTAY